MSHRLLWALELGQEKMEIVVRTAEGIAGGTVEDTGVADGIEDMEVPGCTEAAEGERHTSQSQWQCRHIFLSRQTAILYLHDLVLVCPPLRGSVRQIQSTI